MRTGIRQVGLGFCGFGDLTESEAVFFGGGTGTVVVVGGKFRAVWVRGGARGPSLREG